MMFYSEIFLKDSTQRIDGHGNGWLIAPSIEEIKTCFNSQRILLNSTVRAFREGRYELVGCSYKVNKPNSERAMVYLTLHCKHRDNGGTFDYQVCSCCISTTPSNCSGLFISAMQTEFTGGGFGKLFYRGLENWIKKAGYTFVFLSLAGSYQLDSANKFFRKLGFKNMATKYKNPRSNNTNQWKYKLIGDQFA